MSNKTGAIIGFGKLGLLHFSHLVQRNDVRIKYIVEKDFLISNILKKNFKEIKIISDIKEIETSNIDFVYVTSPTNTHFDIINYFLTRKIPIFSEKPLCKDYEEAKKLYEISKKNNTLLYTGYMYYFFETFNFVYNLIKNNILGEIYFSHGQMYVSQILKKQKRSTWRFNKKQSGGGVLITQSSHLIYLILLFFGDYEKCYGQIKSLYSENNEDYSAIIITSKSNVINTINTSWSVDNYRTPYISIKIEGENGNILVTDDKVELFLKKDIKKYKKGNNIFYRTDLFKPTMFNIAGGHYNEQTEYFFNKLNKNETAEDNLFFSMQTQKIISDIYKINE